MARCISCGGYSDLGWCVAYSGISVAGCHCCSIQELRECDVHFFDDKEEDKGDYVSHIAEVDLW